MTKSVIERLVEANPGLEIWWDSSPLIYEKWQQRMVAGVSPARRPVLEEQLNRLFNLDDPAASLVRGCTTNQPLAYEAVKADPDFWNEWIADAIHDLSLRHIYATWRQWPERRRLPSFDRSRRGQSQYLHRSQKDLRRRLP